MNVHPSPVHPHGPPATGRHHGDDTACVVIALISVWLILSAFAWAHTPAQTINSIVVGVAGTVIGLAALVTAPRVRFLGAILAAWLLISVWWLPGGRPATAYDSLIVAAVLFVASVSAGAGNPRS